MSMPAAQHRQWRLDALLDGIAEAPAVAIAGMTLDSRTVTAGDLFVARRGSAAHGIEFADVALSRGAVAVLCDLERDDPRVSAVGRRAPLVCLASLDRELGNIAARFFGNPAERLRLEGVTGTNGKSSVAWLTASARTRLGRDAAVIGTLGAGRPGSLRPQPLTTPDVIGFHNILAAFVEDGVRDVTLEASSHALTQGRLDGASMSAAAFTNLSRDHLDYHGSMEAYFEAKASLFAAPGPMARVICTDDAFGRRLYERYAADGAVAVSTRGAAQFGPRYVRATAVDATPAGLTVAVESHAGAATLRSPLLGAFNAANLLVALGLLLEAGERFEAAVTALASVAAAPGRMQRVGQSRPAVVVDYAHTPAAISAALDSLRAHCTGALWIVFGCGGDRDRGKRPQMAAAARAGADRVVLTSDNPRSEDPVAIIDAMRAGLDGGEADDSTLVLVDRADAIRHAIAGAGETDWVLIAGKGHETTQSIGGRQLPFDDALVAAAALARRAAGAGHD
jgi:UDP-N-acetylmuramoyl-L-alanyl-D-glutamate--2,6-diaminopimelate ligase